MSNLVTGLLNYAEVGKKRKLSKIDITKLVNDICLDLSVQIKEKQARIQIGISPNIQGFEVELRQLFQNLISNALKFTSPNKPQIIKIGYKKLETEHQFSIEDNGIGIAEEQHSKIFEIFKRLNRRDAYEGTGIGLALCQRIVDMHGGKIWLESDFGKGSTFYFTISDSLG